MTRPETRARLEAALESISGATGEGFFSALVRDLAAALRVRYAFVSECVGPEKTEVRTLAFWSGDSFGENFQYSVAGTPCAGVLAGEICLYAERVQELFPSDRDLTELGAESYLGLPIRGAVGEVIGQLAVLGVAPLPVDLDSEWILKILAARAGAELARTQATRALRLSEERFRRLTEQSSDLIAEVDPAGRFTFVSPNHHGGIGYRSEELLGHRVVEVAAMLESSVTGELEDAFGGGRSPRQLRQLSRIRHRDGSLRWFETAFSPPETGQAEIGIIAVSRDVTERVRMEEHLRETQKLESLGVLASGVAHDFNNLLTTMLGNATLALDHVPEDSSLAEFLRDIESAATRATEFTHQLLTYAGKAKRTARRVCISDLVRDLTQLLRASISRKVEIVFEFAEDLPAVEADPGQLQQVVLNLLTNASEAIGDERGRVRVATGAIELSHDHLREARLGAELPEGHYVFLEVEDDGCGMEPSVQEHIFEPFFTTKFVGRGLGLSALRGIVRSHQGAIRVSSRPGIGTSIRVLLPAARGVESSIDETRDSAAAWRGSGTVLFADDEESVRRMGQRALEASGFSVITATDGGQAAERFREDPNGFVAAVLDLTMPEKDGREALREIRARAPEIPIVLISGYGRQELVDRAGLYPRLAFLAKPFRPKALIAKLAEMLT